MIDKKQRKFYRVVLNSNFALNFNNWANTSNSWHQINIPGIMDDLENGSG